MNPGRVVRSCLTLLGLSLLRRAMPKKAANEGGASGGGAHSLTVSLDVMLTNKISKTTKVSPSDAWPDLRRTITLEGQRLTEFRNLTVESLTIALRKSLPEAITKAQAQLHNVAAGPVQETDVEIDLVWKVALSGKGQPIVLGEIHDDGLFKLLFGFDLPPAKKLPGKKQAAKALSVREEGDLGKRAPKRKKQHGESSEEEEEGGWAVVQRKMPVKAPSQVQTPLFVIQLEAASKADEVPKARGRPRQAVAEKVFSLSMLVKPPHRRDGDAKNNVFICDDKTALGGNIIITADKIKSLLSKSEWGGESAGRSEESCRVNLSRMIMRKVEEVYGAYNVKEETFFTSATPQCRLLVGTGHNVRPPPALPFPLPVPKLTNLCRKPGSSTWDF